MDTEALLDELEGRPQHGEQMSFEQMVEDHKPPVSSRQRRPASTPSAVSRASTPSNEPVVTGRHQDIRLYLVVLMKTFVEMTDAGLVREAPYQVRFGEGQTREPDIIFIGSASFERVHDTYVEGPPDLIIEVLSQESTAGDRGDKFVEYEAAGVREYWQVDPIRELVNLYQLGPDGCYDESRPDTAGRLRSRILKNFVLDVNSLWRRVLPTTVETVEIVQSMVNQRTLSGGR